MDSSGLGGGGIQVRISLPHFCARPLGRKHPPDAGARGLALPLPSRDLSFEALPVSDAPVQALGAQHANFNFDHIQPTIFNQLACLGTKWNCKRRRMRRASAAGKVSYRALAVCVDKLSRTTRTCPASG